MTDSTEVAWEIDGISLQTLCQNVESLASKYGTRGLRGGNVPVAYRRGQVWRRKYVDSHTETLGMWVVALNPDGTRPATSMERQFHANMKALEHLTWNDGQRQVVLTKKWRDPLTGNVVSASALAEPQPWSPEMQGPYSAKMAIDFLLADPYYYGEVEEVSLALNADVVLDVPGDVPTSRITMMANGQLTNPMLTNSTPDPDVWMRLGASVAAGDHVFLDVENFTAVRESDDANIVGTVTRSGTRNWMTLWPTSNTLRLTAAAGAGTIDLSYAPAYL